MNARAQAKRSGFTLMEVILVVVIILIVSTVALPFFSGSMKGHHLRSSGRLIQKLARHSRALSIVREEVITMVVDPDTMEVYVGGRPAAPTNTADGVIDQDVFKNLGYVEDDRDASGEIGVEREIHRYLPDTLTIAHFDKDFTDEDNAFDDLYFVRFFPNGQSEWFEMELEDQRGHGVRLENDPISGKVSSEELR